jgi:hypothetical protein
MVYRELRALTNDGIMNLNPMELNEIYEQLWNVGTLLRSDDALHILEDGYRPWPKVQEGTEASDKFYTIHDRNKPVRYCCCPYPSPNCTGNTNPSPNPSHMTGTSRNTTSLRDTHGHRELHTSFQENF